MKTKRFILTVAAAFVATLCIAGTAWHYECDASKCGFAGDLGLGGGFVFEKATGYCTTCKKFVSLSWKRSGLTGQWKKAQDRATDLLEKAPDKIGTVWNPATGLIADLYACPSCKKPFMQIDDLSLMQGRLTGHHSIFCPACTNLSLKFQDRGNYD